MFLLKTFFKQAISPEGSHKPKSDFYYNQILCMTQKQASSEMVLFYEVMTELMNEKLAKFEVEVVRATTLTVEPFT